MLSKYLEVKQQILSLTPEEQLKLVSEITSLVSVNMAVKSKHNIMELRGLGKEIWREIDVQEYVNQERESWN